ncbi:hypothetical protein C8R46DRAFT_105751 [Mycena filopes]|nr:hypothetical protein C8R46DRAFT_105751 [Mycena filopes]
MRSLLCIPRRIRFSNLMRRPGPFGIRDSNVGRRTYQSPCNPSTLSPEWLTRGKAAVCPCLGRNRHRTQSGRSSWKCQRCRSLMACFPLMPITMPRLHFLNIHRPVPCRIWCRAPAYARLRPNHDCDAADFSAESVLASFLRLSCSLPATRRRLVNKSTFPSLHIHTQQDGTHKP